MTAYELLYNALIFDLHHKIGAHFATVEGLFNRTIRPDNPDYEHFIKVFGQLKADKREISEKYYLLEETIKIKNGHND